MFQSWLVFLFVTYNALPSGGMIIDVRLVNGPSRYEGTVEYTTDNNTWQTTCGINFGFHDARLVCEHIGAYGTNKAITNSPFGSDLDQPTTFLDCQKGHTSISDCGLVSSCSSPDMIGAAACYDDTSLGCYIDATNDRVLPGDPLQGDSTMKIDKCITHCRESTMADYVYAGVGNGDECYCGVAGTDYSRLGAAEYGDEDCQTPCTGDTHSSCGGTSRIAVFQIAEPPTTTTGDVETSQVPELSQPTTTPLTTTEVLDTAPVATTTSGNEQSSTTELTTVSSTHGEDGTKPDSTTCTCMISPTQSTQMFASPSNGSIIGLGVVFLLLVIYSITLTVLHLKLRRSPSMPMEKHPLEGVKPEGDTYTDLDIQLHSATPENRGPLYQDLLPIEGATIQPNKSQANGTDTDDGCYVNQQMANQQKTMRQRTKTGDLQEYEVIV